MLRFKIGDNAELKQLQASDAFELFRVVDSNRPHLREWLPWLDQNTEEAHSSEFIQSTVDQHREGRGFVCGIFINKRLVGTCGYHSINPKDEAVTIGYWLSKDAVGKGLATIASRILINYAFDELKVGKINIPVAVENRKSRAVCERLGLDSEGVKRNAECLYGNYVDHVLYYTTPEKWKRESQANILVENLATDGSSRTFLDGSSRATVRLQTALLGLGTFLPGWKWSLHAGPQVDLPSARHVGYVVSGHMIIRDISGDERRIGPGDAFEAGPGHDAWVEGNVPCVALDFTAIPPD